MSSTAGLQDCLAAQVGDSSGAALADVLDALRYGAEVTLGNALVGVYLTGSFALGQGDDASDVDFLVVARRALSPADDDAIGRLHHALPERPERWAGRLEGSWVSADALRDPVGRHAPWLYVDNGSRKMEHSRLDDSWNGRWVFREAGIPLSGPSPTTLLPAVDPRAVAAEAVEQAELRSRWVRDEPAALLDGWAQPYAVLTHCRLLWAATFGTVAGKSEAAEWVMRNVSPDEYVDVVAVAVRSRIHAFDPRRNRADPAYAEPASRFIEWATREVARRAGRI